MPITTSAASRHCCALLWRTPWSVVSAEGGCEGATTLANAPAGVKICDGKLLYLTEIPVETEGTLYGSVEVFLDDGSIVGVTSQAEADANAAPEIDLSSCANAVS